MPNPANSILAAAQRNVGLYAGSSERCADSVRTVLGAAGVKLGTTGKAYDGLKSGPRLASSFFGDDIGRRLNSEADLQPGDLIGFTNTYGNWAPGTITHVGIYKGNGRMYDHNTRNGFHEREVNTFGGQKYFLRPYAYGKPQPAPRPSAASAAAGRAANGGAANGRRFAGGSSFFQDLTRATAPGSALAPGI